MKSFSSNFAIFLKTHYLVDSLDAFLGGEPQTVLYVRLKELQDVRERLLLHLALEVCDPSPDVRHPF